MATEATTDFNKQASGPFSGHYDMVVIGAGFGGSLAALMLRQSGFRTCLIEKGQHPRFAIGESSTPAADMILRKISDDYNLPWLKELSRYGSWQANHPHIICGIKRGFSYFRHRAGQPFQSDNDHRNELLVAASSDNDNSDTNWLRADVDAFLVEKVKEYGITYLDKTQVTDLQRIDKSQNPLWQIGISNNKRNDGLTASFIIDATGGPVFSKQFLNVTSDSGGFETNSMAIYSHFENSSPWLAHLNRSGHRHNGDYPFNPDNSALHHLIDEGWIWMLRFNNNLLSAGMVFDLSSSQGLTDRPDGIAPLQGDAGGTEDPGVVWNRILHRYPSVKACMSASRPVAPPGSLIRTGRLQRKMKQAAGDGWVALSNTAGFVDPLHSTGIAHTLAGLERVIHIINETRTDPAGRSNLLTGQQNIFFRELRLIDRLVAGCYRSRTQFPLFSAWSMLYFTCAIRYEERRLRGDIPTHFLSADTDELVTGVDRCYDALCQMTGEYGRVYETRPATEYGRPAMSALLGEPDLTGKNSPAPGTVAEIRVNDYVNLVREIIQPFNTTGLLDDRKKNMYRHTAVRL